MVPDAGGSLAWAREKAGRVTGILEQAYGRPEHRPRHNPLEQLILALLSQSTSDANSGRAYAALRAEYASWEAVLAAPEEDLARTLRPGGLARTKAARIQRILREIQQRQPCLSLSFLDSMPTQAVFAYLSGFPGVGPKTAACVLLFALGRPVLPVDTHIHRISQRLGLLEGSTCAEEAHAVLQGLLQDEHVYSFHVNMIAHGKGICRALSPRCSDCILQAECPSRRVAEAPAAL